MRPEAGLDGSDQSSNCFRISHIQPPDGEPGGRVFWNVCSSVGQGARSACAMGQVRSFARQFFRRRAAKSFAGRRDDGYAACEPKVHPAPYSKLQSSREMRNASIMWFAEGRDF